MDRNRRTTSARTSAVVGTATLAFGLGAAFVGPALAGSPASTEPATGQVSTRTSALPDNAEDYAQATYDAWLDGDTTRLEELSGSWIAHFLTSRGTEGVDPGAGRSCEVTGRSTWCTWSLPDGTQVALQIDNVFADEGLAEAVIGAELRTGAGVGVWPITTQEQADNSQTGVDEGHSPWQASGEAVVTFYAENVLGWSGPTVHGEDVAMYTVVDPGTGVSAYASVTQPARQGEGGVWTIDTVGTGNPHAEDPRDPDDPTPTTSTTVPSATIPTTTVPAPAPPEASPPATAVEGRPELTG